MSSPLLKALAPVKLRQYARDAFVRQHNDLRNHPRGVQRLLFKIMFGAQFVYYWINWGTWQKYAINKRRDISHDALRAAHIIH